MKTRTIILWIVVLIIIDQIIKIIINAYFLECKFDIIPSFLEFKPVFNQKHSYINDLLYHKYNLNLGLLFHLILFVLVAIVITAVCDFYKSIMNTRLLDFALIFFIAGWACVLIGNIVWERGVLDFIYLKPLFVFDLKDLYIDCFVVVFFLALVKNKNKMRTLKIKDLVSHVKKRLSIAKK